MDRKNRRWLMGLLPAMLAVLIPVGCQVDKPAMYTVSREENFSSFSVSQYAQTVARDEYEAQGNPKDLPVAGNEAAWTGEGVYRLAYYSGDEWRTLSEWFDPVIQAMYIWNSPVNQFAGAQAQLPRMESLLDESLYQSIVRSQRYDELDSAMKEYGFKLEVNYALVQPYALRLTDEGGHAITRYCITLSQRASKIGKHEYPPAFYDQYPYLTGGDVLIHLYLYVREEDQKIIQMEEDYRFFYYSQMYCADGIVTNDVYPGYAHYLDLLAPIVHSLPGGEQDMRGLDTLLQHFTHMLYDVGSGMELSEQTLEEYCTPALCRRLADEGYIAAHTALTQYDGVSLRCEYHGIGSTLPLRSYITKEGAQVILLETSWKGAATLPEGVPLPARDGNLVSGDAQMYRTSYYIVYQDGQYLIDEFMTHDYFKS